MEELTGKYNEQVDLKTKLEVEYEGYKKQMEELEIAYPKQVEELKTQIAETRKKTEEFEKKNEELNEELKILRAKKKKETTIPIPPPV